MKVLVAIGLLVFSASVRAEILDRIAVTVDSIVITERDITNHLRIAAFLNDEPVVLTAAVRRVAAGQLVEQTLVRREMEISRYPVPALADADPLLSEVRSSRFDGEESFQAALSEYGLAEEDLHEGLRLQLTVLRFIDYRFQPGITVSDDEVERYFDEVLAPESQLRGEAPGRLDDLHDAIEEVLIRERVNQELDEWLRVAMAGARVVYREEAFQ